MKLIVAYKLVWLTLVYILRYPKLLPLKNINVSLNKKLRKTEQKATPSCILLPHEPNLEKN